jgi:hypothetical protein
MVALLVVAVTAALLTSGSTPAQVDAPQAPVEIAVADSGTAGRLVYPTDRQVGRVHARTAPVDRSRFNKTATGKRKVAAPLQLAPQSASAAPAAPVAQPASPSNRSHESSPRAHRKPAEPEKPPPPTPTRTLYRLTKPNGRYFFTIDVMTANDMDTFEGWDKEKLALVWGDWQPGMKGLILSDGTEAYVFIQKKRAPDAVESLYWAGGDHGPYYSFNEDECAAIGDPNWFGYAEEM